jgi:hypothetical protein
MTEPTPAATSAQNDEAKKRLREKVDKLLAADPWKSEGSITLNGKTMEYSAVAAFIPVQSSRRPTSLKTLMPNRAPCASSSTADPDRPQFGCIWARLARNG